MGGVMVKTLAPLELRIEGNQRKAASVRVSAALPGFDWVYFNPNRILLSLDPWQPKKQVIRELLKEANSQIRGVRATQRKPRIAGQGRTYTLERLAEALWAYDQAEFHGRKQKSIGAEARSFRVQSESLSQIESHGEQLIRIAHRMIKAAKASPETWYKTFR